MEKAVLLTNDIEKKQSNAARESFRVLHIRDDLEIKTHCKYLAVLESSLG